MIQFFGVLLSLAYLLFAHPGQAEPKDPEILLSEYRFNYARITTHMQLRSISTLLPRRTPAQETPEQQHEKQLTLLQENYAAALRETILHYHMQIVEARFINFLPMALRQQILAALAPTLALRGPTDARRTTLTPLDGTRTAPPTAGPAFRRPFIPRLNFATIVAEREAEAARVRAALDEAQVRATLEEAQVRAALDEAARVRAALEEARRAEAQRREDTRTLPRGAVLARLRTAETGPGARLRTALAAARGGPRVGGAQPTPAAVPNVTLQQMLRGAPPGTGSFAPR